MMSLDFDAAGAAMLAWLLTYAIHSTILLGAAAIAAWRFVDHHAWLDVIWKTALVGPLVTASLHLAADVAPLGGRWAMPSVTPVTGTATKVFARSDETRSSEVTTAERLPSSSIDPPASIATAASPEIAPVSWRPVVPAWPSIAVMSWLAIAALGLARYGARLRQVYRGVGSGVQVTSPELLRAVVALAEAARLRHSVTLTSSAIAAVPLALAGRRIVLPERFEESLDADEQRAALAHELAHVIRRDPAWRIAAGILEHVFVFQPLNRVARIRLGDTAEFLSDQWAVQQTQSPIALARCLAAVASWSSAANDTYTVGASAMARSDSAMIRRVTRILNEPVNAARPRMLWPALALALVAIAAPRVTAMQLPSPVGVNPAIAPILNARPAFLDAAGQGRTSPREWSAADIAEALARLRVFRPGRPGDSLEDRWRWAIADAKRQRFAEFWIAYSLDTDVHAQDLVMTDTRGSSFVSNGRFEPSGPPLTDLLGDGAGNLVVLLHYRGDTLDRGGYRTARLGFEFGRTPVFWLGYAPESESFDRVQALFGQVSAEKIQVMLIELASMHSNSDMVLPFLTRLVEPSRPTAIRHEAAEGFGHHHDPRSVEILLRVAGTDADSEVRAEAAETIGEVQTPQAIPALTELVAGSDDTAVRREAAEAFGDQPADRALPAIERVLAINNHEDVLTEIVEALGDIDDASVLALLVQTATTHPNRRAQQEAVETLGDVDEPGVVDALARIAREHHDAAIQREAVETLGDRHDDAGAVAAIERILTEHPSEEIRSEAIETLTDLAGASLHPQILALAASATSARIRRDAVEAIADALSEIADSATLDAAEQALERVIFDDADSSVRMEALDALDELPRERSLAALRRVLDRHPDARVRRQAAEHLRERQ